MSNNSRRSANLVSNVNIFSDIDNNRIGIGTTNPQYTLDVYGDLNFNGTLNQNGGVFVASRWTSGAGNDIYRNLGNVGIGSQVPTSKLDVAGPVTVSGGSPFYRNSSTIESNYTIGASFNEMSIGPVTIQSGVTVTVNGNWSVV
jgi:hypothetical protein